MSELTPMKAIRLKCLDCCCGNAAEVRRCGIEDCSLHPYRFGKRPSGGKPDTSLFRGYSSTNERSGNPLALQTAREKDEGNDK